MQICLDLSHVLQFEHNVHGRSPVLPRSFPWERVAETHLARYVKAEYEGRSVYLDQHLADIPAEEYRLLTQVVEVRGQETPLAICLEMEPRDPGAFVAAVNNIHTRSAPPPRKLHGRPLFVRSGGGGAALAPAGWAGASSWGETGRGQPPMFTSTQA